MAEFGGYPRMLRWMRTRGSRRHTVEQMAGCMGVAPLLVRMWERGDARPTLDQARAWADWCEGDLSMLFLRRPPCAIWWTRLLQRVGERLCRCGARLGAEWSPDEEW